MKKTFALLIVFLSLTLAAQEKGKDLQFQFKELSELTMIGKMFPDTPNPYERLDYAKYGGFTEKDIRLLKMSSGIAVTFRTDSPVIAVQTKFTMVAKGADCGTASRGYDLYIKKDGKWLWAGACCCPDDASKSPVMKIVSNMDGTMKECLLYLPTYSHIESARLGVVEGSRLEAGDAPFRHRIGIFGSSFTHGSSTTRAGLTYPAIFTRKTGIQLLSIGVSGDCTMQPQFANAFAHADVDAFLFDSFSNGSDKTVKARLFAFIEALQAAHPGKPLIFQRTIWRENRNFDQVKDEAERKKAEMAEVLMAEALKKYKDVYFITPNATTPDHETTEDGTHPGDHGYYLWAESIIGPVTEILAKYGIK